MADLIDKQKASEPNLGNNDSICTKTGLNDEDRTTGDLISRQAAIDALAKMMPKSYTPDGSHPADEEIFRAQEIFADCIETLEILPSAQPEPHEGHWILHETSDGGEQYECSECGVLWEFNDGTPEDNEAFYCPHCGADMKGEQDGH